MNEENNEIDKRNKKYQQTHKIIDDIDHKICSMCKEWKPSTEEYFYKNKSNKTDGLHPWCKKCAVKRNTEGRDLDRANELNKHYYRTREKTRQIRKRVMDERRVNGQYREWQRNNPEKIKSYNLKRSKNKTHVISEFEWEYCKSYFNYECAYCGMTEKIHKEMHNQQLHREHVVHEGANDLSNCIPACRSCNSAKHVFTLEEWYSEQNINYTEFRYNKINKWLSEDYLKITANK